MNQIFRTTYILVLVLKVSAIPLTSNRNSWRQDQNIPTGSSSSIFEINVLPLQSHQQQYHYEHCGRAYPSAIGSHTDATTSNLYGIPMQKSLLLQSAADINYENNNYETNEAGNVADATAGNEVTSKRNSISQQSAVQNSEDDNDAERRNALRIFKRQKPRYQQHFIPSISVGAMTNLGDFFDSLKNNIEILEKGELTEDEEHLLSGNHPVSSLRKELSMENMEARPAGTAAFLHAIRTYRPSQRIRALVSTNPEGYHGSNFLDPNYMWLGLGK